MPRSCPIFRWARVLLHLVACVAAVGMLPACEKETIRSYEAPKDPPRTASQPPPMPPASPDAAPQATWVKPPDWRLDPQGSSFAMASFVAGPDDPARAAKITLTRLAGDGGGLLANINRWRGQLQLAPVASMDDQPHTPLVLGGAEAVLVDLTAESAAGAEAQRIVGVLMFHAGEAWFVKMTGPASTLDGVRPAFDAFVASIRIPHDHQH